MVYVAPGRRVWPQTAFLLVRGKIPLFYSFLPRLLPGAGHSSLPCSDKLIPDTVGDFLYKDRV